MKKYRKTFIIFVVLAFVGVMAGASVSADGETGRYYISGSDFGIGIAKSVVGEFRHEFDGGFTDDLAPGQIKALEVLGAMFDISIKPVELYYIQKPPSDCSPWPECKNNGGGDPVVGRTYYPSDKTPWGIEMIYNNSEISSTFGGAGVDVAVLDTGVYKNHLDLVGRVKQCKDFTWKRGINDGSCDDKNGHGTHVAGTILADGGVDGMGIYGIAPEANLYAYKVCGNNGSCWADDIATAIRMAVDKGAEIISMSLGSNTQSSLIANAIDYAFDKGALIVAAAGNDGPAIGSIDYPGANFKVIAVGAIDVNQNVPDWSSRGINDGDYAIEEKEVEFGAPGVNVESTWNNGGYNTISGTSMATPHISGLLAKLWRGNSADTRTYLHSVAIDISLVGDDPATGFGLPIVQ